MLIACTDVYRQTAQRLGRDSQVNNVGKPSPKKQTPVSEAEASRQRIEALKVELKREQMLQVCHSSFKPFTRFIPVPEDYVRIMSRYLLIP